MILSSDDIPHSSKFTAYGLHRVQAAVSEDPVLDRQNFFLAPEPSPQTDDFATLSAATEQRRCESGVKALEQKNFGFCFKKDTPD